MILQGFPVLNISQKMIAEICFTSYWLENESYQASVL